MVVREFCEIRPELEFRGFCHNGVFTACSQYYKSCYCAPVVVFVLFFFFFFFPSSVCCPSALAGFMRGDPSSPSPFSCRFHPIATRATDAKRRRCRNCGQRR